MPVASRVVLLVIDGLKAADRYEPNMPGLADLFSRFASTSHATTVIPSVTAAAMTSLFSGVEPRVHGVADRFGVPANPARLTPITRALAAEKLPVTIVCRRISPAYGWVARRIGAVAGVSDARFGGRNASEILDAAIPVLATQRQGLVFMHWPDVDDVGHAHGWRSAEYALATREVDRSVRRLTRLLSLDSDPSTLLVICADHGGGGTRPREHDSDHPSDTTIPIVIAGAAARSATIAPGASLLDIPPTVLWSLDVAIPPSYSGRVLREAFEGRAAAA